MLYPYFIHANVVNFRFVLSLLIFASKFVIFFSFLDSRYPSCEQVYKYIAIKIRLMTAHFSMEDKVHIIILSRGIHNEFNTYCHFSKTVSAVIADNLLVPLI
jgi:hypothetical protein